MKKCLYCDSVVDDKLNYCPHCGAVLPKVSAQTPIMQQPRQTQQTPYTQPSAQQRDNTSKIIGIAAAIIMLVILAFSIGVKITDSNVTIDNSAVSNTSSSNNYSSSASAETEAPPEKKQSYNHTGWCLINGTHVNMRQYPSLSAGVIFQFPGYEEVYVSEVSPVYDGKYPWCKISYKGYEGWVYGQFVK